MANILYWGTQGIKRNMEAGAQLFRIAAKKNDPKAMFNYGISLLKVQKLQILQWFSLNLKKLSLVSGHWSRKNEKEAIKNLENSAQLVTKCSSYIFFI